MRRDSVKKEERELFPPSIERLLGLLSIPKSNFFRIGWRGDSESISRELLRHSKDSLQSTPQVLDTIKLSKDRRKTKFCLYSETAWNRNQNGRGLSDSNERSSSSKGCGSDSATIPRQWQIGHSSLSITSTMSSRPNIPPHAPHTTTSSILSL